MNITLDGTEFSRCNIPSFQPYDVEDKFVMLAGNSRYDIVAQKLNLTIAYDLVTSDEFDVINQKWLEKTAHVFGFVDWNGNAVTYNVKMTPPQFIKRRTLAGGEWLIGQCTFNLNEL
jgi:hypothetical protein